MLPVIRLLSFPRARGCRWALQAVVCCEPSEAPLVRLTSAAPPPRCRGGSPPSGAGDAAGVALRARELV